ncbi:MAG: DEAD/DEAH box helicase [Deltaproteobacteria bacterium]|jgi:superfamily II RNA helicase|nr:DEAD/DEAH box helicase [Deltaproteobacteria bacterium]
MEEDQDRPTPKRSRPKKKAGEAGPKRKRPNPPGAGKGAPKPKKKKPDKIKVDKDVSAHFLGIGQPEPGPFVPDPFQLEAIALVRDYDVIVSAPTGSGKTWIAQKAIEEELGKGHRVWYTSPLKALSNSKYIEFGRIFGGHNVGLLTGDLKLNTSSPVIVGTTEILRNQLYDSMARLAPVNYDLVILDEAHFLGDSERGVVWEEVLIYLPSRIRLLLLSATIQNAKDIADWMARNRGQEARVVQGGDRPVPLIPLCLESGRLRLLKKVANKPKERRQWRDRHLRPPITAMTQPVYDCLNELDLLPAIFFLKSRADCDKATNSFLGNYQESPERRERRVGFIEQYLREHPHLERYSPVAKLWDRGIAAHHAGQLPYFKLLIEELMTRGLLSTIFATSTVSAGVNFPARTVVIPQSDRFDGAFFKDLTSTELAQMTGRAGRRGQDKIGFALLVPGQFMNLRLMKELFESPPNPIMSHLKINFPMVLNLLDSLEMEEIQDLLSRSFMAWQSVRVKSEENLTQASKRFWEDFKKHVRFLNEMGLVTNESRLTDEGRIASKLRLQNPLVYYEAIRKNALPTTPALLAATVAYLSERPDDRLFSSVVPADIHNAIMLFGRQTYELVQDLRENEFPYPRRSLRQAMAIYSWANSDDFGLAYETLGRDPGDMVRTALMTAELLNQLSGLEEYYPELSQAAEMAASALLRPPVT